MAESLIQLYGRQNGSPLGAPPGVVPNYIDPVSRGYQMADVALITGSIAAAFVATRLSTRLFTKQSSGLEDGDMKQI